MMSRLRVWGLGLALLAGGPAWPTPPQPPASLDAWEASRSKAFPLQGEELPFRILLRQEGIQDLVVSVHLRDPERAQVQAAAPFFSRSFRAPKGQELRFAIPFKTALAAGRVPGDRLLDVRLTGKLKGGGGFSDRFVAYLVTEAEGKPVLLSPAEYQARRDSQKQRRFEELRRKDSKLHPIRELFDDTAKVPANAKRNARPFAVPEGRRIEVRPAELTPFLKEHSVDSTRTSYTSQDPITVRGRFWFTDIDGVSKPLVNAAIHLWDDDTFGDEHLGSVATDWDGRWSFTVNNDDGWLQDGRDLYYTCKLDTTRLSLGTCNFLAGAYEWKSSVRDDMSDGVVLDFGDETASTHMGALQVWSVLNLAWNHASTAGGFDPGKIEGCFPASGTFWNGRVNIAAGDVDGPDSITHEYGHGVMDRAYAGSGGDPSSGGPHGFGDCGQNRALSWSEGFATGFMLSLRPDGRYNWHEGDGGQAIEAFSSSCRTGDSSEGWVAAALFDFIDAANDDNGGTENRGRNGSSDANAGNTVALATILRDAMVGTRHNDVMAFWTDLAGELTGTRRTEAQRIMHYNWMPVALPSSCVATKVAVVDLKEPESLLGGLRKFRDQFLKTWPTGRELANAYYRSSPEIALLLLKDGALRKDALIVMKHAAALGETLTRNSEYQRWASQDPILLSPEVAAAAKRVLDGLSAKGSEDLKRSLGQARKEIGALESLRLSELEQRAAREKAEVRKEGTPLPGLKTQDHSPRSREALKDEQLQGVIRRRLGP